MRTHAAALFLVLSFGCSTPQHGWVCDRSGTGQCFDLASGECVDNCPGQSKPPPEPQPSSSPCGSVPEGGRCIDSDTVERCVVTSGSSRKSVARNECSSDERCSIVLGEADCRLTGECRTGETRCSSGRLESCQQGRWKTGSCAGTCRTTVSGAVCDVIPTKKITATFAFEAKQPNAEFTDWDPTPRVWKAGGFIVFSSASGQILDATTTNADGSFSLLVPQAPGEKDFVTVGTVAFADGNPVLMVADPGLTQQGEYRSGTFTAQARPWTWSIAASSLKEGATLLARVNAGSSAAWVFVDALSAYEGRAKHFGRKPRSLVIWVSKQTTWDCGACSFARPVTVNGARFESQIALGGGADEQYWSDSVTGHELGHWLMDSFGSPIQEAGKHTIGVHTFPGQAWSEGWATYHQAALLERRYYFDKQHGGFFWFDLEARDYQTFEWKRPTASAGLLQKLDENEVAAMLWELHRSSTSAPLEILSAFGAPAMRASNFGRGYTEHEWDVDEHGAHYNVENLGIPAAHFADFLDALNCRGFSRAAIDAATDPSTHYPYPSSSPICP